MSFTRRDFLASTAMAAIAGAAGRNAFTLGWQGQQPQPVFTPLRRNVGFFTMRGGTIGWLINNDAVVCVDTQFPAEGAACLKGLNERSGGRGVDLLLNTHHHGDHSGGNISFRGAAKKVVAHAKANEHMRQPPGGQPPADQLFPDTTYTDTWSADVGDERVTARYFGRAHTSGDSVITFERANVVHMGDLMFNNRHPVVDRSAGATLRGWISVLESTLSAHSNDTLYIFGHANTDQPVTGNHTFLSGFRDYISAVLAFADAQVKSGKSRAEIMAMRDPLKGFEAYGPFGRENPREILTCAYEEVVG